MRDRVSLPMKSRGFQPRPGFSDARNGTAFRLGEAPDLGARLFRPREGGRQKIEKRSFWRSLP